MYGIVNKAIQGLVTEKFGEEAWKKVKEKSGVEHDIFLSNEAYPDEDTFKLAGAAASHLNIPVKDVLIVFGEYWVLNTGLQHYGSLMKAGGNHLKEFLINLPNFHSRVMLIYPELTPPEFKITNIKESSLNVHYYSTRSGLTYFVYGLLQGLGKMYKTDVNITVLQDRATDTKYDHDLFDVNWQ